MRPATVTIISTVADDNGISTSQKPGAAGNLTITGALASGGVATMSQPSYVAIASDANDSAHTFTLYGTDANGTVISESITGPSSGTVNSTLVYKTVTRVAIDAAATGNIIVGTSAFAYSTPCPVSWRQSPANWGLMFDTNSTGTTFKVQYTMSVPTSFTSATDYNNNAVWADHASLTSLTADAFGSTLFPVTAFRLYSNQAGTSTATLTIISASGGL